MFVSISILSALLILLNNMKEKQAIVNFIKNVANNNFKQADALLASIVNEKIKARVQAANAKLTNSK